MSCWRRCTGRFRNGGMCVLWNTIRVFFSWQCHLACPLWLSQFEGDEEEHWDYSCHTAHSSRVQSSVLINCEWGQTDTHYLSIENALWLQKGPPLQHSLLPQWALYWSGQGWGTHLGSGATLAEYHTRQAENSQNSSNVIHLNKVLNFITKVEILRYIKCYHSQQTTWRMKGHFHFKEIQQESEIIRQMLLNEYKATK